MSKYKIGDVLICCKGSAYFYEGSGWREGKIFTVTHISMSPGGRSLYWPKENPLYPIFEESCMPFKEYEPINNQGENNMSVSSREIRNLKLSEDDRLLLANGIVTSEGTLTGEGEVIVWDKAFEQYKDSIIADIKAIEQAKKDSSK